MKQIYTIINQKGGVGKSTTAHALGWSLVRRGNRVLFVDLDSQSNLSFSLRANTDLPTSMDVLTGEVPIQNAIQPLSEGAFVLPAGLGLALAEQNMTGVGTEYRLKEALDAVKADYDYIIIDTPPALGILTVNALTASTRAIIPAQADIYSFQGISQLYKTIMTVKKYCNPDIMVSGILLTRYSPRAILSRDVADMLSTTAGQINTKLFDATIREAVSVKEAQANQVDVYEYSPKSNVALDYEAFTEELLKGDA
ncbi:MAG: ParA family protein [Clostridia bacterium]|nr:ParA family protein [Clostridia bacterium]